jgi:hypothetical protein
MGQITPTREPIDADFEVISDGRPEPRYSTWTFWGDDVPAVLEIVVGVLTTIGVWAFFRAIHWFG